MTPALPYRVEVATIEQAAGATMRRRRCRLRLERVVQLVRYDGRDRPAGPYCELQVLGARGGRRGQLAVSNQVGGPELLDALGKILEPGTWRQRIGALGFRTLEVTPVALDRDPDPGRRNAGGLELVMYGPNGGEQGRIVLDRDGRDRLREHVRTALEPERIGAAA